MPLGPWEILIIAFFVLLLFGARRLPEIGRLLGTGMREFKEAIGMSSNDDEPERRELTGDVAVDEPEPPRARSGTSR